MNTSDNALRARLFRNVGAEASARVLYLATRFFIPPFVLAHIGMEAYGLYSTMFILVAYAGVSTIGFSNAYIKYVAEFSASGEHQRVNRLLSAGLFITAPLCTIVFAGLMGVWPAVSGWLRVPPRMANDARFLAITIVGSFLLCLAVSVFRDALCGLQKIAAVQKIWITSFVVETLVIVYLVTAGWGVRGMGVAFLVRTVVDIGGSALLARREIRWLSIRPSFVDRASLKLLFGFGGIVQFNSLLSIFLNSVERALAAPLAGLGAAGLMDIAKKLPGTATAIPSSFASSLLPSISDLSGRLPEGKERRDRIATLYLCGARYMNVVSGTLFAFIVCAALPLLVFWVKEVPAEAPLLMIIFAVASQVHMLTGPGTSVLKGIGRPYSDFHYTLANFAALAITVPLARVIVGHWNVLGIASAVAAATLLSASWYLIFANRTMGVNLRSYWNEVLLPGLVPYAVAAAISAPLYWIAPQGRWFAGFCDALAGIAYLAALAPVWLWFCGKREEKDFALSLWSRLMKSWPMEIVNPWGLRRIQSVEE